VKYVTLERTGMPLALDLQAFCSRSLSQSLSALGHSPSNVLEITVNIKSTPTDAKTPSTPSFYNVVEPNRSQRNDR
jgi:hypothetical protein